MILSQLRPSTHNSLLETGASQGCSTIIMAQALIDSGFEDRVHTIEIEPNFVAIANDNFIKAKVSDTIIVYQGDSRRILKNWPRKFPRFASRL
jgi:predicted O-methyltransferase YrrM